MGAEETNETLGHLETIQESVIHSAQLAQVPLLPEDVMRKSVEDVIFPEERTDRDGQQVDLREFNSWNMKLGDVPLVEMLEVQLINVIAPFILNSRLRPLMEKGRDHLLKGCPLSWRFVVNVSAMEGKFNRRKTPRHPHTNMAKAALNMMTKTSAQDFALSEIFMNSVDTGWINDENPLDIRFHRFVYQGFSPPIDEIDGAARVLDPIFSPLSRVQLQNSSSSSSSSSSFSSSSVIPTFGQFLKDYHPTEW